MLLGEELGELVNLVAYGCGVEQFLCCELLRLQQVGDALVGGAHTQFGKQGALGFVGELVAGVVGNAVDAAVLQ